MTQILKEMVVMNVLQSGSFDAQIENILTESGNQYSFAKIYN